jgi:type IV pilus biogenesis protein CpaD/CtpE
MLPNVRKLPEQLMRLPHRFFFAAAVALLAACASMRNAPASTRPQTTLKVDNQAYLDMTIYVMRGEERVRLGLAPGASTSNFVIPGDLLQSTTIRFVADPIGSSRASISEEVSVREGDHVAMQIPPN